MEKNKTTETSQSVSDYINAVSDKVKREDCFRIAELFKVQTGFDPKMWGPGIIGFGTCHYKYESGREGDMPLVAFSPRANAIVLYLSGNFDQRDELLQKFGKHKTGKGCIYIRKLDEIDEDVLINMVSLSVSHLRKLYP